MVPQEFRKSLCIAAGCITLVEALIWIVIGIFSIGEYGCSWDFFSVNKGTSGWTLLYISYFMGECRDAQALGFQFIPPTDAARILQVWIITYTIIAIVWILASILLIVAANWEVRGKFASMLYNPWIVLSMTLVILDLGGGITHLIDLFKTKTPDDFAEFVTSTNWTTLTEGMSSNGVTTWMPSFLITLLFTRVLIIWLLNIYLVYIVYSASNAVRLYPTKYVESPLTNTEMKKTWKDKFYQGPDPALFERPSRRNTVTTSSTANQSPSEPSKIEENKPVDIKETLQRNLSESEPAKSKATTSQTDITPTKYKFDKFGIPIEVLDQSELKRFREAEKKNTFPRSSYPPTGRVYDHTGQPVRPESVQDKWQDAPPPIARGVKVPPELNKFGPFSYIDGDQPQFANRQQRRRPEKPPLIPRPDYTIADRRPVSLEYVPNRFKVPSPKRPYRPPNSFRYEEDQRSPTTYKVAPTPAKKPMVYPRSSNLPVHDNSQLPSQERYLSEQAVPSPQQAVFTRQTSQVNNYDINKLY